MANKLNELADISTIDFSRSINCTLDPSYRTTIYFLTDLIEETASQVDVNLDVAVGRFEGAIKAANEIIDDVK
ncbi:MAG: hypothetical protein U0M42_06625 [Acutalibacteraceae bacterium]|nr:hypothetical protein [Acutalibacteraceae bacterium]